MFLVNQEYLKDEISSGGTTLNKSGCYEVQITDAVVKVFDSGSECVNFNFEDVNENRKAWPSLFYKNSKKEDITFNLRHLTHISYLLNTNPKVDSEGNLNFKDKIIGVILEVGSKEKYNEDGVMTFDFQIKGFYDPSTKQTAKEKKEGLKAEVYHKFLEKYKDAKEVTLEKKQIPGLSDGFFEVSDEDLPF